MFEHSVVQVSDTHLSAERAYGYDGWLACLSYIREQAPNFVAVTGDLVLDDPDDEEDQRFTRDQLGQIPVPWAAVPGNHDVGDANPSPYMNQHVNESRLARYLRYYGTDRWVKDLGRWRLIGLNALLLGTGLEAEEEQYDWLSAQVLAEPSRPLAMFLHKPLCINRLDEASSPDVCVLPKGRDRLLQVLSGANLRLVASGHNHHFRTALIDGIQMVWAPSTSQVVQMPRPFRAQLRPGLVQYWFGDDAVEFALVEPNGIEASDVTHLIASYRAMRFAPRLPVSARAFGG